VGKALRIFVIVAVGMLMIPAGFGLLGCTLCAVSGGVSGGDRLSLGIAAMVCLGILVGGIFVMGKLVRKI